MKDGLLGCMPQTITKGVEQIHICMIHMHNYAQREVRVICTLGCKHVGYNYCYGHILLLTIVLLNMRLRDICPISDSQSLIFIKRTMPDNITHSAKILILNIQTNLLPITWANRTLGVSKTNWDIGISLILGLN